MADETFSPEIQKRIDALPEPARKLIYSTEMSKIIQDIATKHRLHIDQTGALEAEAAAAMLGITELDELAENISGALDVDEERGSTIAKDLNEILFVKIRESMKNASQEAEKDAAPQRPTAVETPPIVPMPAIHLKEPIPTPASSSSVAMPSAAKAAEAAPAPLPVPPPAPVYTPAAPTPKPALSDLSHEEAMLSEKKAPAPAVPAPVQTSPLSAVPKAEAAPAADPGRPQNYKADPYREPLE